MVIDEAVTLTGSYNNCSASLPRPDNRRSCSRSVFAPLVTSRNTFFYSRFMVSPLRDRWFADSPVEGSGFEPSVPGREIKPLWETGLAVFEKGAAVGEPKVRIHLPPARSLRTISSEAAKPPPPFYRPTRRGRSTSLGSMSASYSRHLVPSTPGPASRFSNPTRYRPFVGPELNR